MHKRKRASRTSTKKEGQEDFPKDELWFLEARKKELGVKLESQVKDTFATLASIFSTTILEQVCVREATTKNTELSRKGKKKTMEPPLKSQRCLPECRDQNSVLVF